MHTYNENTNTMEIEQVSLILGKDFVLTFQEREGDVFEPLRNRIRNNRGRIRKGKADYLAYVLIDAVVDGYFDVIEKLGDQIDLLEDDLITAPGSLILQKIHFLKRELIFFRNSSWPLRNMMTELERQDSKLIEEATNIYFRDLYDHVVQMIDNIEIFREMVTGMMEIYLSSMSNKMNEIMKFLTIIGTIFIPLTFIAGIYGMNFHYMPELGWKWGYFEVLLFMGGIGTALLFYFKKKKWIFTPHNDTREDKL